MKQEEWKSDEEMLPPAMDSRVAVLSPVSDGEVDEVEDKEEALVPDWVLKQLDDETKELLGNYQYGTLLNLKESKACAGMAVLYPMSQASNRVQQTKKGGQVYIFTVDVVDLSQVPGEARLLAQKADIGNKLALTHKAAPSWKCC